MGADGGSIPDRRDLVRTKGKVDSQDKSLQRELFLFCALSRKLLAKPVVADPLGKIYNKDAVIEFLLDRSSYGDGDQICGYLKGVKDLLTLNLTDNPEYTAPAASTTSQTPRHTPFVCPLSLKEMSGAVPFIALRPCGCVFSDASVRAIIPNLTRGPAAKSAKSADDDKPDEAKPAGESGKLVACPNCTKEFDPTLSTSILAINPPKEVQQDLLEALLVARANSKSSKKRKAAAVDGAETKESKKEAKKDRESIKADSATQRSHSGSPAPGSVPTSAAPHNSLARSVHQKLAEQEQKRLQAQAGMSDAVRAMFKAKENDKDHRNDHADFFGRTFTRYAA